MDNTKRIQEKSKKDQGKQYVEGKEQDKPIPVTAAPAKPNPRQGPIAETIGKR